MMKRECGKQKEKETNKNKEGERENVKKEIRKR
jgi:hypothetical protein